MENQLKINGIENKVLIGSGDGNLYTFDDVTKDLNVLYRLENDNEHFCGISETNNSIIINTNLNICTYTKSNPIFTIYNLDGNNIDLALGKSKAQGDNTFIASNGIKGIVILSLEKSYDVYMIKFNCEEYTSLFDTFTSIDVHNDKIYINLSKINDSDTGGLVTLNKKFEMLSAESFDIESDCFYFIDDEPYILGKNMLINNKGPQIKFDSRFLCRDFSVTDDKIFIVGRAILPEKGTTRSGGFIAELDRHFKQRYMKVFERSGAFVSCLYVGKDKKSDCDNSNIILNNIEWTPNENIFVKEVKKWVK